MPEPPDVAERYEPPRADECQVDGHPIELADDPEAGEYHQLYREVRTWRGLIVFFSFQQTIIDSATGLTRIVSRIDTCHGKAHRHRFGLLAGEIKPAVGVVRFTVGAHNEVDAEHDRRWAEILTCWEERLRLWRQS
jgi:hypothetical protein